MCPGVEPVANAGCSSSTGPRTGRPPSPAGPGGRTAAGLRLEVGDPRGVRRYHELLGPAGVHDELRLSLTIDGEPWATGVLYRWSGSSTPDPFTRDDVALAAAAAPLVASAVRAGLLRAVCDHPAVDVPPGSLVLDAHGRVVVSSPAAQDLLAGLDADGQLAAALSAVQAGTRTRGRASLTVAGHGGLRILHGSRPIPPSTATAASSWSSSSPGRPRSPRCCCVRWG